MPTWAAGRRGDVLLRVGGLLLLALSVLAIRTLVREQAGARFDPGLAAFVLAATGFLGGSGGTALMVLGHHLGDEVELSERWRPRGGPGLDRLRGRPHGTSLDAEIAEADAGQLAA